VQCESVKLVCAGKCVGELALLTKDVCFEMRNVWTIDSTFVSVCLLGSVTSQGGSTWTLNRKCCRCYLAEQQGTRAKGTARNKSFECLFAKFCVHVHDVPCAQLTANVLRFTQNSFLLRWLQPVFRGRVATGARVLSKQIQCVDSHPTLQVRTWRRVHQLDGQQVPNQVGRAWSAQLHQVQHQIWRLGVWRSHMGTFFRQV